MSRRADSQLVGYQWCAITACRTSVDLLSYRSVDGVADVLSLITEAAVSHVDSHAAIQDIRQSLVAKESLAVLETKAAALVDIAKALGDPNAKEMKSEP